MEEVVPAELGKQRRPPESAAQCSQTVTSPLRCGGERSSLQLACLQKHLTSETR
jgi:hypothetical protein